ncbi:thioredoxin family protein [Olleya sp. HaHaR_3_96]|uniref:thioredoxin family protein n=1 Tax=Olleya sp. HaHaR_3_96 TaxID=2745560 RepID=UPI001C4E8FB0|nr:thioredoxin fold domain-containing protein [Olleya sp. HaHaR_3_96]QXP60767.1 thioredoxin family protein [Olleya sp. HaHaR_3_96]
MKISLITVLLLISNTRFSQTKHTIHWLSFEQLEDSLKSNPKKVIIDFYADWCKPCLKMQKETFTDSLIVHTINKGYYAVKMNIETKDTIHFGNQIFVNKRLKKRNPIHQIPLLMAQQKNKPFSLPALVFLDEQFNHRARYFQYLNANQLLKILKNQH